MSTLITEPIGSESCSDGYLWIIDDGYAPRLARSEGECYDITLEMVFGTLPVPEINRDEARKIIEQCCEQGGCDFEDGFIRWQRVSRQQTTCAGCGQRKNTPLRRDEMGGYVCLTCIDQELTVLRDEIAQHDRFILSRYGTWGQFGGDHACAQCYPDGDSIHEGFRCAYHRAKYRQNAELKGGL